MFQKKLENWPYETKYNIVRKNIHWKMDKVSNKSEVLWAYAISYFAKGGASEMRILARNNSQIAENDFVRW